MNVLNLKGNKPQLLATVFLHLLLDLMGNWFELCCLIYTWNSLSLPFGALCHPWDWLVYWFGWLCAIWMLISVPAGVREFLCFLGFCAIWT